eukprot:CAMPEP_0113604088 /NCGR_PEP_ID=MMETSP0017_2-20120614/1615_1 /TAXON_ID=2856 /ORGANISM="Cylindrotheca closterium" /LENGTH=173 /DNA_ID=CAMNT_0000512503 /DNA_START=45 /DNA_END=566 /DNA_ORIENTATION=+ /assembly_acc=CAM_ASM_000147
MQSTNSSSDTQTSNALDIGSPPLTKLQKIFFWFGAIGPIPSIFLYEFLTDGTVEHFGGTVSDTALFWCTIASSADAMIAFLCANVLWYPTNSLVRTLVLRTFALYSIFHWGGFLRAHYFVEPHPSGPGLYIMGIVTTWAAYIAWTDDFFRRDKTNSSTQAVHDGSYGSFPDES